MTANRRPFPVIPLIAVLVVWSILAYAVVFMFSGGHACHILQTVPPDGGAITTPMTEAEMAAQTALCNRPDVGSIIVFGAGYLVIAAVAIGIFRQSGEPEP
jgi:hypothetical protein